MGTRTLKTAVGGLVIALAASLAMLARSSFHHATAEAGDLAANRLGTNPPPAPIQAALLGNARGGAGAASAPEAHAGALEASAVPSTVSPLDATGSNPGQVVVQGGPIVVRSPRESEQLEQLDEDLVQLQEQAARAESRRESRRQEQEAEDEAQYAATLEALDLLRQAEMSLAEGNSDGVDAQLARAGAALSGRTRLDVEAAREALSREDLYPAREFLAAALAERRTAR